MHGEYVGNILYASSGVRNRTLDEKETARPRDVTRRGW